AHRNCRCGRFRLFLHPLCFRSPPVAHTRTHAVNLHPPSIASVGTTPETACRTNPVLDDPAAAANPRHIPKETNSQKLRNGWRKKMILSSFLTIWLPYYTLAPKGGSRKGETKNPMEYFIFPFYHLTAAAALFHTVYARRPRRRSTTSPGPAWGCAGPC